MFLVYGVGAYGTVDRLPGVCHIATTFFHLYWFPVFPYRSYIVLDASLFAPETETPAGTVKATSYGFVGVRVPLSWWSVLMGYVRAVLVLMTLWTGVAGGVFTYEAATGGGMGPNAAVICTSLAFGFGFAYWFSHWFSRAGWTRENELRSALGLPPSDDVH